MLHLQTTFGSRLESWLATRGYCEEAGVDALGEPAAACEGPWKLYLQACYWSLGLVLGFDSGPQDGPKEPHMYNGEQVRADTSSTLPTS